METVNAVAQRPSTAQVPTAEHGISASRAARSGVFPPSVPTCVISRHRHAVVLPHDELDDVLDQPRVLVDGGVGEAVGRKRDVLDEDRRAARAGRAGRRERPLPHLPETLDAEGWLHTGDIGHVEDGFVKITDRK